ncbi:hypothetical protein P154DRAFT_281300 [Amniculicola lignicola CBS 123094]|uniref:Uncharacterized protein n=1 Tax=Amniculicola lignicola CBS 123094 TaxID=1392246 RepID=A0A6A5W9M3_9PLEO|nr:hypothetical protein P154DRAFT_281300 [Amniculicola lignicola CBS 123094]
MDVQRALSPTQRSVSQQPTTTVSLDHRQRRINQRPLHTQQDSLFRDGLKNAISGQPCGHPPLASISVFYGCTSSVSNGPSELPPSTYINLAQPASLALLFMGAEQSYVFRCQVARPSSHVPSPDSAVRNTLGKRFALSQTVLYPPQPSAFFVLALTRFASASTFADYIFRSYRDAGGIHTLFAASDLSLLCQPSSNPFSDFVRCCPDTGDLCDDWPARVSETLPSPAEHVVQSQRLSAAVNTT